jgi:acyl carrier protein
MKQTTIVQDTSSGDTARVVQGEDQASDSIRDRVALQFHQAAAHQERVLQPLSDDLVLLNSGLDSLCFAIIVAELEDNLGLDPFSDADEVFFPVTFGDFVALYEAAAKKAAQ